jgi:hypothetical protein
MGVIQRRQNDGSVLGISGFGLSRSVRIGVPAAGRSPSPPDGGAANESLGEPAPQRQYHKVLELRAFKAEAGR